MKTKHMLTALGVLGVTVATAAALHSQAKHEHLETVPYVDVARYMGEWYEVASFPNRFQKGCHCTMAKHTLNQEKGYVEVLNSCRKGSATGKTDEAKGKAFIKDTTTNAKLKVQFFWPFRGDYWIIALADDYSYAMVGHPNREYLWILNRMPQMEEVVYQKLVATVQEKGFNTKLLQRTDQTCFMSGVKR
jgi:apolipoprotein D and lipocalin family protein